MSTKHISYLSWLLDLFYSPQTSKFILKLRHCNEQTTSQNYQAFLDGRCKKLGTNHNLNSFSICSFSSELLLKEQIIIPVKKKTLNNAGHIDAKIESILVKFAKKNPAKSAVFYWLFLGEVSLRNFRWNRPIFLRICPWKSFKILIFSAKIPQNRLIFPRILTFFPWNQPIFPWICPENPAKFWFFFTKYQKPWLSYTSFTCHIAHRWLALKRKLSVTSCIKKNNFFDATGHTLSSSYEARQWP